MSEILRKPLTAREMEVVTHVLEGRSNKGISNELGISDRTVTVHIQNIFQKLGIHSRYELMRSFVKTEIK